MQPSTASKYTSLGITLACFWAIYGILGCGGGVPNSSTTVPNLRTDYRDYAPFRESVTRTFNQGTYSTFAISPSAIDVSWGPDNFEEFRIRPYAGEDWVMLDAYRSDGHRWPIVTNRVEINYGNGWILLPNDTNPYTPVNLNKPYTLRQWGVVAGEKRYFWQHRISLPELTYNSCWKGLGDSTRLAIKQEEVWWDEVGGWFRGAGTMKDGVPTGEVTMDFYQTIGRDAGYVWTGSGVCLIH